MKFQVSTDGQCRANGTWFNSVFDFLEHYRSIEVLPLESGGGSDIRLTSFVVNDESGIMSSSSNSAEVFESSFPLENTNLLMICFFFSS